jgi:hypothetical protein
LAATKHIESTIGPDSRCDAEMYVYDVLCVWDVVYLK